MKPLAIIATIALFAIACSSNGQPRTDGAHLESASSEVQTERADDGSLTGTYVFVDDESDDVMEAFEPAIQQMSRLKRGFARRVLREEMQPDSRIKIDVDDNTVTIHSGDNPPLKAPADGTTIEHENEDGDIIDITATVDDTTMTVHSELADGYHQTTYRLQPDGWKLDVDIELDVEDLPKPVSYSLVYERG